MSSLPSTPTEPALDAAAPADEPPPRPARKKRDPRLDEIRTHWVLLALSLGVLVAACLLSVGDDRNRVNLPVLQAPIPELCVTKRLSGIPCPGCGMTRCFIRMAHFDVVDAWPYNPAGVLLFGLVVAQLPWRSVQLWRLHTGRTPARAPAQPWLVLLFVALLVGQWAYRLILG